MNIRIRKSLQWLGGTGAVFLAGAVFGADELPADVAASASSTESAGSTQPPATRDTTTTPALDTIPVKVSDAAPPPPDRKASANRLVEEVVVTAQRREEAIRDVPIAIAAFSADSLEAQGVAVADDLARVIPGLTFTQTAGFSVVYLRGVGTEAFLPGADQTVPQYVDGVNLLAAQGVQNILGRVKRIEVLKGPQGTLFGRNSTGGAINIVTEDPSTAGFEGDVELEAANYGTLNQKAYFNIPLTDTVAVALAGFNQIHDAYYVNVNTAQTADQFKNEFLRGGYGKLLWQPLDNLSVTLLGQYTKTETVGTLVTENIRPAPVFAAIIPLDKADRRVDQDVAGGSRTESKLASAIAAWSLDSFDLKFIGSDQKLDVPFNQYDFDTSNRPLVSFHVPDQFAKQKTAEFQILSNKDSPMSDRFEWIAGLFYLDSFGGFNRLDLQVAESGILDFVEQTSGVQGTLGLQDRINALLSQSGLPPILSQSTNAVSGGLISSKSLSGYAQGTYSFSDEWKLTLGGRYQNEKRGIRRSRLGVINPENNEEITLRKYSPPDLEKNQFAPRISLQWLPNVDTQIYTSYSRGYQSPTYNAVNFFSEPDPVKQVVVDAYELGMKAKALNGALTFDTAVFYTRQKDVTVATVSLTSGGVVRFDNAAGSEIKGAEATFVLTPLPSADPGLAFTGGTSYLDARYTDFKNGRGFDEATGLSFGESSFLPARDFSGNRMPRTPKFTYTLGINQNVPLESGWIEFAADTYYNSGFFFSAQSSKLYANDSYQLLNARVTYFYEPWTVQATAFVQNVTDEKYFTSMFLDDFGASVTLDAPRTYGLRLKWTF